MNKNLQDLYRQVDSDKLAEWAGLVQSDSTEFYVPRFDLEWTDELNGELVNMGMAIAFDRRADFREMTAKPVWISRVVQKAHVKVHEEGTEAAAATAVIMMYACADKPVIKIDRPFFFVIRDDKTGLILFMGSVVDPTKN